ncbi:unnamed protein product [Adineta steineri]|uniref:Uncharacterized protein n=1 Tax=Adineta steineri TaxID=433720 RepID=A0A815NS78_9BILA|nr:unnamed protein product [Adineta steineri]CAF4137878.1 unnamed protein product [Adineta steineri]
MLSYNFVTGTTEKKHVNTLSSIPSLHAFNPDTTTWPSYRDRMTFYFQANGITIDADRKPLFLWSIGDQVYSLLESLVAPRILIESELTYTNLIGLLDKHYDDTKNIITPTIIMKLY